MSKKDEVDVADLSGFDVRAKAQEGVAMPLLNPAGRPTKVKLGVRGVDSRAYQAALEEEQRQRLENPEHKSSVEERNAAFLKRHAALVAWWSPPRLIIEKGGAPVEHSPANAAKLLEQNYILEQVLRFSTERGNFL